MDALDGNVLAHVWKKDRFGVVAKPKERCGRAVPCAPARACARAALTRHRWTDGQTRFAFRSGLENPRHVVQRGTQDRWSAFAGLAGPTSQLVHPRLTEGRAGSE